MMLTICFLFQLGDHLDYPSVRRVGSLPILAIAARSQLLPRLKHYSQPLALYACQAGMDMKLSEDS